MQTQHSRQLLALNLGTLLLSTSGILGKLITLSASHTILLRCAIAFTVLFALNWFTRYNQRVNWLRHGRFFVASGVLLAFHWVSYFYAIHISTVAVAFISLFTFPVMTTLLEPLFFKTRLSWRSLANAGLVFSGIVLLVPAFDLQTSLTAGALAGLGSALLFALRNLMNKQYIGIYPARTMMTWQLLVAGLVLLPSLLLQPLQLSAGNAGYLLLLGVVTTAAGQTLFVNSFKHFATSTASIITSAQPVYGIALAVIFTGEELNWRTLAGGAVILGSVVFENLRQYLPGNQRRGKVRSRR